MLVKPLIGRYFLGEFEHLWRWIRDCDVLKSHEIQQTANDPGATSGVMDRPVIRVGMGRDHRTAIGRNLVSVAKVFGIIAFRPTIIGRARDLSIFQAIKTSLASDCFRSWPSLCRIFQKGQPPVGASKHRIPTLPFFQNQTLDPLLRTAVQSSAWRTLVRPAAKARLEPKLDITGLGLLRCSKETSSHSQGWSSSKHVH